MARLHRPTGAIVELGSWAVVECIWALASHLVEAVAHFGFFRAELGDEFTILKVASSRALIMNRFSVGKEGTAKIVQSREFTQEEVVDYGSNKINGVGWAPGDVNGLYANRIGDSLITPRVGSGGWYAAVGRTGSYGNGSGGLFAHVLGNFQEGPIANLALGPIILGGYGTLHHADEFTLIFLDRCVHGVFCLLASSGHDRLMILHGYDL